MPRRQRLTPKKRTRVQHPAPDIPDDEWHEIRGILDERRRRGRIEYLVDWEPSAVTGQIYDPSWQHEVTQDALEEWAAKKAGSIASSSPPASSSQEAEPESQDSQPPRPANWRSLERSAAAQSSKRKHTEVAADVEASRKKQRREETVPPAEDRELSVTTASSTVSLCSSPPPSQQFYALHNSDKQVAVILEKDPNFDPSDFHSVAGTNTQTTALSSQSLSQLESQDAQVILTGTPQDSRQTVPDSQDLLEPSISQTGPIATLSQQGSAQRVIADSQADSQPLATSPVSIDRIVPAGQVQSSKILTEPNTEIPSGQRSSQSDNSLVDLLRGSLGTSHSNNTATLYRSQPPFTPFNDSITTTSHLATETPSQGAALGFSSHHLFERQSSPKPLKGQDIISSQLSQAAQIVGGASRDPEALGQSSRDTSGLEPTGPSAKPSPQGQSQLAQTHLRPIGCDSQPCLTSSMMDGPAEKQNEDSQPSPEDELHQILDMSAAGPPSDRLPVQEEWDKIFSFGADPVPSIAIAPEAPKEDTTRTEALPSSDAMALTQAEVTILSQPRSVQVATSAPVAQEIDLSTLTGTGGSPSGSHLDGAISGTLRADLPEDVLLPGTISPADVLRSADGDAAAADLATGDAPFGSVPEFASSRQPPPMGQSELEMSQAGPDNSFAGEERRDELITLPFHASARDEYMSCLISYRDAIQQYSSHFTDDEAVDPPDHLVGQIDELFRMLQNICDFPPDLVGTSLEELDAKGKTKYARDANGKFSFVYELLLGITADTRVAIVARSAELLRLIFNLTEALEIECVCEALAVRESSFKKSAAVVRLALPSENLSENDFDIIVGFDNSLSRSSLLSHTEASPTRGPLILRLVTTHGMDHIDHKIDHDIVPLERRHAILYAIVAGRNLVKDPERGEQEPHEIAKAFFDYINGETDDLDWVPVPIPDRLLMSYLGSQGQPVNPGATETELDKGLKRKYDEEEDDEAKRLKTAAELDLSLGNQDPPVTDEVQRMIDMINPGDEILAARPATVSIHLVMLELIAQQLTELERQHNSSQLDETSKAVIESQDKQLKSYKRSMNGIYTKYRAALSDRQLFEKNMNEATQKQREAEQKAVKNAEKLEQRIADLEADKKRLLGTDQESNEGETPLATNERLLKEAQDKVKVLEKRLVNAREESEYVRDQYRNAQNAAGETGQLRAQLKKAEEDAGKNKVRIHEINVANSVRGYLSRISELQTQLRERDAELDRVREEMRASKNGRRETRQTSVPRSPRMGVLSPRAPARSYPSSTSRGGSPVAVGIDVGNVAGGSLLPGMQVLPQAPANGRWNPL